MEESDSLPVRLDPAEIQVASEMISLNTLQIELIHIIADAGNSLYCLAFIPDTPIKSMYSCIDIHLGNGKPNGRSVGSIYSYASELICYLKKTGPFTLSVLPVLRM